VNILITGASAGIGEATAILLASRGHKVLMAARRKDKLSGLAAKNKNLSFDEMDLSKSASIASFVSRNENFLKDLSALVNNAGLALGRESFQTSELEDIRTMISTNVTGLLELTRLVLPFMIAKKSGHVVNLGSVAGRTAYKGGTVYCATKAAVHMITDAMRMDLGGTGVRVSTVGAGRVETDFSKVRYKGDLEKAKSVYSGFRPLKPEDMAEAIAWVLERPAHVNIQHLEVMSTDQPNATEIAPVL